MGNPPPTPRVLCGLFTQRHVGDARCYHEWIAQNEKQTETARAGSNKTGNRNSGLRELFQEAGSANPPGNSLLEENTYSLSRPPPLLPQAPLCFRILLVFGYAVRAFGGRSGVGEKGGLVCERGRDDRMKGGR